MITGRENVLRAVPMPGDATTGNVQIETSAPGGADNTEQLELAAELVKRAEQTGALIRVIEDPELLLQFGGVGALLRFRIEPRTDV